MDQALPGIESAGEVKIDTGNGDAHEQNTEEELGLGVGLVDAA